jgi:hypothetical protein
MAYRCRCPIGQGLVIAICIVRSLWQYNIAANSEVLVYFKRGT